ncbi:MAG: hypothetical protein M3Y33_11070 [Actinomycetota bacterium]|nr:hypothetical protein [Actinomycetota bacterium]
MTTLGEDVKTVISGDLDLSWVLFADDGDEPCDGIRPEPCTLEAVARAVWLRESCGCVPPPVLLCAGHRDEVEELAGRKAGLFECTRCLALWVLARMEPVR